MYFCLRVLVCMHTCHGFVLTLAWRTGNESATAGNNKAWRAPVIWNLMGNVLFRSQRGIKGGNIFGRNSHNRNIRGANFGVSFRVDLIPRVLPFVVFWCSDVLTSRRSELLGHLHHEWVSRVLSHTGVLWQMLICRVRIKSLSAVASQFLAEAFQEQLHQDLGEFLSFTHTHAHCIHTGNNVWSIKTIGIYQVHTDTVMKTNIAISVARLWASFKPFVILVFFVLPRDSITIKTMISFQLPADSFLQ